MSEQNMLHANDDSQEQAERTEPTTGETVTESATSEQSEASESLADDTTENG